MAEKVGSIYYDLDLRKSNFQQGLRQGSAEAKSFGEHLKASLTQMVILGAASGVALVKIKNYLSDAVGASVKFENAMIGLNSIASAFGQNADKAKKAAAELAKDGLMSVADSAGGLKNLLASGFNLDQAIVLMKRFKDSAAFGRQGSLSFGQAIVSATEGIKNGNSILVDNAGVTKNLSVILEEAGYSAQDLMKATTDAGVRQALFNGILKETNPMLGDAARLSDSFAGKLEKQKTASFNAKKAIGDALKPALESVLKVVTPLTDKFTEWVKQNPKIVTAIVGATGAFLGLLTVLGLIAGVMLVINTAMLIVAGVLGIFTAIGGALYYIVDQTIGWNTVWEKLKEYLVEFWEDYGPGIKQLFTDIKVAFGQFMDGVKEFWRDHGPKLVAAFEAIWSVLTNLLIPKIQELYEKIATLLGPEAKNLGMIFGVILFGSIVSVLVAWGSMILVVYLLVTAINFAVKWFKTWNEWWEKLTGGAADLIRAIGRAIGWIIDIGARFQNLKNVIRGFAEGLEEIIWAPFRNSFGKVGNSVDSIKKKLVSLLNFNSRNSPSLIDYATAGTSKIVGLYTDMFNSLDQMAGRNHGLMAAGAAAEVPVEKPSMGKTEINVHFDGAWATSREHKRAIGEDLIDVVNDVLRSKKQPEIGGGYIKGSE